MTTKSAADGTLRHLPSAGEARTAVAVPAEQTVLLARFLAQVSNPATASCAEAVSPPPDPQPD